MLNWKLATESKPREHERVLLKIKWETHPVIGYWRAGHWEACTANIQVNCGAYCYGGTPDRNFDDFEVTHYAEIGGVPNDL